MVITITTKPKTEGDLAFLADAIQLHVVSFLLVSEPVLFFEMQI